MRLIDADKLIAQLKRYTWNMDADDAGYATAIHDLLQDIDSQDTVQPTVNPWISVKERLPEKRVRCFANAVLESMRFCVGQEILGTMIIGINT